jgi:hypothetical protein
MKFFQAIKGFLTPKPRLYETAECTVRYIHKFREVGELHYAGRGVDVVLNCEWLGWGGKQKPYLNTHFSSPERLDRHVNHIPAADDALTLIIQDLKAALTHFKMRFVLERTIRKIEIPPEECERAKNIYADLMLKHGTKVSYDRPGTLMVEEPLPGRVISWKTAKWLSLESGKVHKYLVGHTWENQNVAMSSDMKPEDHPGLL